MNPTLKHRKEIGLWIGRMKWDLFVTLHFYKNATQKNSRRNITYLNKRNSKRINKLFFVSEKGIHGTTHSHLLIETNDKKGVKRSLDPLKKWSHVHCVDVCPLIQENGVLRLGEYLAKSIDEDIDYDILIND